MSSSWGRNLRISLFGESHGPAVGVVLEGLPPGIPLDMKAVAAFMARRAPGTSNLSTARREADQPHIQSGVFDGKTTGTPLCALIANTDTRPADYERMQTLARPGHADHTGYLRYAGCNDPRGGGHFSARLTAPLVFAGAVAVQALALQGVVVGGQIAAIHKIVDTPLDPVAVTPQQLAALAAKPLPVQSDRAGEQMRAAIEAARAAGDSVGGVVACYALGLPPGLGTPMFDGLENRIASLLFGVPAVKGVEFGEGFAAARLMGSENNDPYRMQGNQPVTQTNCHGGILGGISSGMPLVLRAAFKPTPSIAQLQHTVDYRAGSDSDLSVRGRHDPCVVPRAVVCVESCVALAVLDSGLEGGNPCGFKFHAHRN